MSEDGKSAKSPKVEGQMAEAIEDFADFQLHVRGRAEATVRGYRADLRDLAPVSYTHLTLPTIYSV